MRVANPIYDTVFKHLMEDPEIASELISRLIGRRVLSLRQLPQETQQRAQGVDVEGAVLQVLRLDFAAEIELEDGSRKKVLIEMQKAHEPDAIARFRSYLSRHYAVRPGKSPAPPADVLPIIAIYFLGFRISRELPTVIRVRRSYEDGKTGIGIEGVRSPFLEALTHDAVAVQIPDIDDSTATELDRALVLFNQNRRVAEDAHLLEITEEVLRVTDALLQHMARRLLAAASSTETIDQMAIEDEITDLYGRVLEAEAKAEREIAAATAAKEQALAAEEVERAAKERALAAHEAERAAKEEAVRELAAIKEMLRRRGIDPAQS